MESDWKKFRDMVVELRERYLAERNPRIIRVLSDSKKSETERFWDAFHLMEKEAKTLVRCLDGHSRSSMQIYMASMLHAGMLKEEDLHVFSDEVREQLSFAIPKKRANKSVQPTPGTVTPRAKE